MIKNKICNSSLKTVILNKKAHYEYFINEVIEAGLVLQGWEVKALRSGKINISNSYVLLRTGEAYLLGAIITPLNITSSYVERNQMRNRKLLLNKHELNSLFGKINRKGYTAVALSIYWKDVWCKVKIGISKGKKERDKRLDIKEREWKLNKRRIIKKTSCQLLMS